MKLWGIVLQVTKQWCGKETKSTSGCQSFSNDSCLQHSYQTPDILFIYKGKAIIVEEFKWFRYLIHRKMASDHHKGVDCRIPFGWKWVISFATLIRILQWKSSWLWRGVMFYDHWATWLCKHASSIRIHSNSNVWLKHWNYTIMMTLLE